LSIAHKGLDAQSFGMIVNVDDPGDPRIADYLSVRERDLVGRQGRFIAEGEVVLGRLIASPLCRTVSVLISAKRLERLTPLLAGLDPATPVFVADQPVLDAIAGFHLHRGILALGERVAPSTAAALLDFTGPGLAVGLYGVANHDNMGGVFRNAAAFGVRAVLIDPTSCDPLYRKAIRVSVGASLIVPFAVVDDPLAVLEAAGFEVLALSPRGTVSLADVGASRTAALFGAEGPGLTEAVMARSGGVRIPMAGGLDSLNLATTSGIVLQRLAERLLGG